MARFNLKMLKRNATVNRAGGKAFTQSPELRLASLLLSSFAQDQFYRSAEQSFDELKQLLTEVDPAFAARAAVYARHEFGMRSITHVLAAELAPYASGKPWAKGFYDRIVRRPDDMTEILAYYFAQEGNKTVPNALRVGFARAFDRFDGYQLAKYRKGGKQVKLVDVVNLVHPVPTQRNAKVLQELVDGTLRSTETWESKLSRAGQVATTEQERDELKGRAWADLLRDNKLGYFALLRNLRNLMAQAPELLSEVCDQLTDRQRIKRSLVLPFRFTAAMRAAQEATVELPAGATHGKTEVLRALNRAVDLALDNVPRFPGKTLVILDDSGSMTWSKNRNGKSPMEIGSLFAAILLKSNDADLIRFSSEASYRRFNPDDATLSIAERLVAGAAAGGTNMEAALKTANRSYDRIVLLSDMQAWMQEQGTTRAFADYRKRHRANPFVYSFDLQGYGSLQFPEERVFCLAGFSDKVFDILRLLETDRDALVRTIENVSL